MEPKAVPHRVDQPTHRYLGLCSLTSDSAHVFAAPFPGDCIDHDCNKESTRDTASFARESQTHSETLCNGTSERRRECIADLAVCRRLASCEPPIVREPLEPSNHPDSKARHSYEIAGRGFIGNPEAIDTEGCPSASGSRWSEVG